MLAQSTDTKYILLKERKKWVVHINEPRSLIVKLSLTKITKIMKTTKIRKITNHKDYD